MEGYVYVMSNKAMPGLVKVGYTTRTPAERAARLNGTHSPHPVDVEYFIRVPDPRAVEHEAHLRLRAHREGKEWFRCSREVAIAAVKRSASGVAKDEFSRVEEEKRREAFLAEAGTAAEARCKAVAEEDRRAALRREVETRFEPRLAVGVGPSYIKVWGWCCLVSFVGLGFLNNATFIGVLFGGGLLAAGVAFVVKGWLDDHAAKSPAYRAAASERQEALDAIEPSTAPPAAQAMAVPASPRSAPATAASSAMPKPAPSTTPSWVTAAALPKVPTSSRAKAPVQRSITGDYIVALPIMPIAIDKSPEQRARERAELQAKDPSA
ncbi:GIY-YIG nuclease family protein [Paraburkholderia sediminicola]|uniref:GIY-YIG nuclease family protein n=1 Tax=Paraburkholderia sediminicola TaxID=458836 RepID=UPI0038BCFFFE